MGRQDIVSPQITQLFGTALPTKRRAVAVTQAQAATIDFQCLDSTGNHVDLTLAGPSGVQSDMTAYVRIREAVGLCAKNINQVACTITNYGLGNISFALPTCVATNPGVYSAEIAIFDTSESNSYTNEPSGGLIFSNKLYIWVDRGLFGNPKCPNAGPPTIDEVRLYIRDNAPEENLLLDNYEFDLAELCQGTELGVRYWNESQPPINLLFDTTNYAVRDKWLVYITGHLLRVAAHRFRRNHLPYQAGGLSIDDQNKFQQYDQVGMLMIKDYQEWVKLKKVSINCMMAITSSGSPYGAVAYQLLNTGV